MGPVDQQKRELCKQAYLLLSKYLAAANKEGVESFEFRRNLRKKEMLDIDMAAQKEVVAEVTRFKEAGGVAALGAGSSGGGGGVKAAKSKGAGGASGGMAGAAGLPPLGPLGAGPKSAAKPSKSGTKGGKDGTPSPTQLPPKIGAKVNRWWATEGQWYTAVVTDYNNETNLYRLTYNLGSSQETYEDFDLDGSDTAVYEMTGEKVNLLAKTGSAAVNNSTVLQPYLARSGGGAAGGGGGSKSSKKRRSDDDDSDDDF